MRFLVAPLLLAGPLSAHPHSKVEQQAMLSIGLDQAVLNIRIVPSYDEGSAIFAHIDLDGDGKVSATEATQFGEEVLAATELIIDETTATFDNRLVTVPDFQFVAAGEGVIEVKANTRFRKLDSAKHVIGLSVRYEGLSHDWFIQPFFFGNLSEAFPKQGIDRSENGLTLTIRLSDK